MVNRHPLLEDYDKNITSSTQNFFYLLTQQSTSILKLREAVLEVQIFILHKYASSTNFDEFIFVISFILSLLHWRTKAFSGLVSESCHLWKFSDDSLVLMCIRDGRELDYRELIDNFVEWYSWNHLLLYANKIKELEVDFSRSWTVTWPRNIMEEEAGIVED